MLNCTQATTLEAARCFLSLGWALIPVPQGSKAPILSGWQDLRLTEEELPKYFDRGANLGLLLGTPSGGLVDIDLDSPEALIAAPSFLPNTGLTHGRPSKPRSHRWYVAHPVPETKRFQAPDGSCLVELRSSGAQTVVPPSTHSGEVLVWHTTESPAEVDGDILRTAVVCVAACSLLAKYWPKDGSRHFAALAAGGLLLRGGLSEDLAAKVIETAARVAGDEEWSDRGLDVRDTAQKLKTGRAVTGAPTLASLLQDGDRVTAKLREWLALTTNEETSIEWDLPLPFVSREGPPFPTDTLPDAIRSFVEAQAIALQVPPDLVGCLVLGVGAAAVAGRSVVRLNQEWAEPLNLFVVTILPSGERKSPAFRAVTGPLEEREQELAQTARAEIELRKAERDILEKQLQTIKAQAAKAKKEEHESYLEEVMSLTKALAEFEVPRTPRLLADDATSEAVASLLAEQGSRIAIMSTEGGLFETLAGRYADGVMNIDVYLKGYSGDPLRVDRKSRPPEFVPRPALTLCLTVQPSVIRDLASKRGFRGRGLLARFLYSVPRSMVGYRSNEAPPVPDKTRQAWRHTVKALLALPIASHGQEQAIRLSPEARVTFQEFRDKVENQLRPGAYLSEIADWGNKLAGAVARVAGLLHLFANPDQIKPWKIPISQKTMRAAMRIGVYFAAHAGVVFNMMGADERVESARRLWASIQHCGFESFSQRDLYLKVRRRFTVDELGNALQTLVDMGYIQRAYTELSSGRGRPPSPLYHVNPLACAQKTQNPQKNGLEPILRILRILCTAVRRKRCWRQASREFGPIHGLQVRTAIALKMPERSSMEAEPIVKRAQELGITLSLAGDRVRYAPKSTTPPDLVETLRQHKAEVMEYLRQDPPSQRSRSSPGLSAMPETVVRDVLAEIRPYLPAPLKRLPDDRLLILVNWSIVAAWERALRRMDGGKP